MEHYGDFGGALLNHYGEAVAAGARLSEGSQLLAERIEEHAADRVEGELEAEGEL